MAERFGADFELFDQSPSENELLLAAKEEMGEMSKEQGELVYVGTLADVLGADNFEGSVSLQARLYAEELSDKDLDVAFELFQRSYVEATPGASKRCVDGRGTNDYKKDAIESYGAPLGPQIQGGTVDEAAAYRLDKGYEQGSTILLDTITEAGEIREFAPGSHDDEHGPEGCGAVKGQEAKLAYYIDSDKFEAIKSGTQAIEEKCNRLIDDDRLDHLPANAKELLDNAKTYFEEKVQAVKSIEKINPKGKVTLVGQHNEVAVIVNCVPYTTLHTNQVVAESNGRLEAFGLDAWSIDNPVVTADALATLMNLTDGSLRLYFRVSNDE